MPLDKYLKEKYVYSGKRNIFKSLYFLSQKYLKNKPKYSYSFGGVDLLASHFFKDQEKGVYLDIGCHHPISGSNTYLLYRKGWSGINIDLDLGSIELFDFFRSDDHNEQVAVSDCKGEVTLYSHHSRSPVQTVSLQSAQRMDQKGLKKTAVASDTLNSIIENSKFKDCEIDFLSIDIEGHEFNALKYFDFEKYNPKLVVIEYNDPELAKQEFHYQSLENIFNSDIYKLMCAKNYKFVNWHHSDLIFVSDSVHRKRNVNF